MKVVSRMRHVGDILRGCRPFSAENCPLDSFPGATNPLAAAGETPLESHLMKVDSKMGQKVPVSKCPIINCCIEE